MALLSFLVNCWRPSVHTQYKTCHVSWRFEDKKSSGNAKTIIPKFQVIPMTSTFRPWSNWSLAQSFSQRLRPHFLKCLIKSLFTSPRSLFKKLTDNIKIWVFWWDSQLENYSIIEFKLHKDGSFGWKWKWRHQVPLWTYTKGRKERKLFLQIFIVRWWKDLF